MLNPLVTYDDYSKRRHFDKAAADSHIKSAKQKLSDGTYRVNEDWFQYTIEISSSNPKTLFFASLPLLPAIAQLFDIFRPTYYLESCTNNGVQDPSLVTCLENNQYSVEYIPSDEDVCDTSVNFTWFRVLIVLVFVLFYIYLIYRLIKVKYQVKMMGIGAKPAPMQINDFKYVIVFCLLILVGTIYNRILFDSQNCARLLSNGNTITFGLSLSAGNVYVAAVEYALIYSCFFTLLYRIYKDPWIFFISLNKFLDQAEKANEDLSGFKYDLPPRAEEKVRAYFLCYKENEEEKVILFAAMEDVTGIQSSIEIESNSTIVHS